MSGHGNFPQIIMFRKTETQPISPHNVIETNDLSTDCLGCKGATIRIGPNVLPCGFPQDGDRIQSPSACVGTRDQVTHLNLHDGRPSVGQSVKKFILRGDLRLQCSAWREFGEGFRELCLYESDFTSRLMQYHISGEKDRRKAHSLAAVAR